MRFVDIIDKKRNHQELSSEDIQFWIDGVVDDTIPDYQTSALLMAIVLNGMTEEETMYLTKSMMYSGHIIDLSQIKGVKADKHSTGGVGDKTSLALAPMVASCGLKIAKMSGRGLGHTGGTLDKLESIEGFNCYLTEENFKRQVDTIGIAIIGQTNNLVPADKKLYALRDVTDTVKSIPLIAASIMSKKLASGSDTILLDVKYGEGAFMNTKESAVQLAESMISIGKNLNKNTVAMITKMNQPLGNAVGNSVEVIEAINTLKGNGPRDFTKLCIQAAEIMLIQGNICDTKKEGEIMLTESIKSGKAFEKFREMVIAQGGNIKMIDNTNLLPHSKFVTEIKSNQNGYIKTIHSEQLGRCAMLLGAGRSVKEDKINYGAGIVLNCKVSDKISIGDTICYVHHDEKLEPRWLDDLNNVFLIVNNNVKHESTLEKIIR